MSCLVLDINTEEKFHFYLLSDNGVSIFWSVNEYSDEQSCYADMVLIKKLAIHASNYQRRKFKEKHYFVISDDSGNPLGISENFENVFALQKAKIEVESNAARANFDRSHALQRRK